MLLGDEAQDGLIMPMRPESGVIRLLARIFLVGQDAFVAREPQIFAGDVQRGGRAPPDAE